MILSTFFPFAFTYLGSSTVAFSDLQSQRTRHLLKAQLIDIHYDLILKTM